MNKPLYKLMNKFDPKTQIQINSLAGVLSAFDENVVSDEDYLLIKDKNINKENDMEYISDILLKPWLSGYSSSDIRDVMKWIDFIMNNKQDALSVVFMNVSFIFDNEIEDKRGFLLKVKELLEKYMHEAESTDPQT